MAGLNGMANCSFPPIHNSKRQSIFLPGIMVLNLNNPLHLVVFLGTAIGDIVPREEISLESLNGKTLGFDSYNIIYQFLSSIRGQDGTPLMDSHGIVTSHLTGLFYRTINLVEKGVKPVFVFDGKPPALKGETLKKRHEIRTDAIEKHEKALKDGDMAEAKKWGSRALRLDQRMIDDAKQLVSLMGFPAINAPGDGEAQLSQMAAAKKIDGVVSQDYDTLLFGTPVLYRNVGVTGKRKLPGKSIWADVSPEKIVLEKVLSSNQITRQKLIWIGILIGTDFNEKFPKIGIKTALKLVKENDSFEGIISAAEFEPEFGWKEVEAIFTAPEFTDDYRISFSVPQKEKIIEFLCDRHDFSAERVQSSLNRLSEKMSERTKQSTLGAWS
ncbi:Flap endonuclease 1 [uncultured archaeon]|nr:Flap endonuclease 1 [uncultured archaeon]